jgi:hypothetical protein
MAYSFGSHLNYPHKNHGNYQVVPGVSFKLEVVIALRIFSIYVSTIIAS